MTDLPKPQISMHSIPVGSGLGAAALISVLLLGMAVELPMGPALWGMGTGVLGGFALIAWRSRRSRPSSENWRRT
jgi:hypothetical protein